MTREIRIFVLGANPRAFMLYRATAPAGVNVGPLQSGTMDPGGALALWFIVNVRLVGPFVQETAKEQAKDWLVEFIVRLEPKRVRIQGREPKDQAELERFASDEFLTPLVKVGPRPKLMGYAFTTASTTTASNSL